MKFIVTKSILLEALNITGRCITNSIIPILDNYKFNINKNELEITGSNMEVFLTTKIEIQSEIILSICLPSARLLGLIKELPEQPITFEIIETLAPVVIGQKTEDKMVRTVKIKAGNGVFTIPAEDGENFPEIKSKPEITFDIKSAELLTGINNSLFACKNDGSGSALNGMLFSIDKKNATYVGCNGYILGTYTHLLETDKVKNFILPAKVLSILQGLPLEEILTIGIEDNNLFIQVNDDTLLQSVLVDNKYPDYEAVIPANQDKFLSIDRSEFLGAVKRVSNFSNQITHSVKLNLTTDNLNICAENIDFGEEGSEDVPCNYDGETFTIASSSKHLVSVLNKLSGTDIHLSFSNYNRAFLLRETKEFDHPKQNLFLIMPVTV